MSGADPAAFEADAARYGLTIRGILHPDADPALPAKTQTLLLLGPDEPQFWDVFAASPEATGGARNPMDRWSARVLADLARRWDGHAVLPTDGPPFPPFSLGIRWCKLRRALGMGRPQSGQSGASSRSVMRLRMGRG